MYEGHMADGVRATAYYSGDVQGVGFRYSATRVARGYNVSGYVENLSDGRVRLVVEGQRAQVEGFLTEVRSEMAAYVVDVELTYGPATGEFTGFRVHH
jgi:acylphosphatase